MDKPKFPRAAALDVARELVAALKPVTDRLVVAGSLRRRKLQVGDVEILYVPKLHEERDGLFDTKQANLADRALAHLLGAGVISRRRNALGSEIWGARNKLAVHKASGIPVDLFEATDENWFNYLVCRTGGAESNIRIASTAQARGWTWKPYDRGFLDERGLWVPVACERDVFEFLGLRYLEPWQRQAPFLS